MLTLTWYQRKENRKKPNKPFSHPKKKTNQPKKNPKQIKPPEKHSPKKTPKTSKKQTQTKQNAPKQQKQQNKRTNTKTKPHFSQCRGCPQCLLLILLYFTVPLLCTSEHTLLSYYSYLPITEVRLDTEAQPALGSCRASEPGSVSRYAKVQCLLWILLNKRTGVSPGQV